MIFNEEMVGTWARKGNNRRGAGTARGMKGVHTETRMVDYNEALTA